MIYWPILCLATEFPKHVCPSEQLVWVCAYTVVRRCEAPGSPQMLYSWHLCDFCLSVCICFGSSDYKLSTAGTVCYQTYIHKWAKWGLSEPALQKHHKNVLVFFRLHNLCFWELPETPYLKISYPNNIWVFTFFYKNGVLFFQCKHGEVSVMLEVQRKYKKFFHV